MSRISVIVPVYKVEQYLDRCVQSIVDQTYRDLEIILVDDGSPDNCPAMCDRWAEKDPRIRVIHKENGGLSDARNAALAEASGEYICFVDSDDWIHPEYVQQLYGACVRECVMIAACDVREVYNTEAVAASGQMAKVLCCDTEAALETLIQGEGFRAVVWNKLYHRSVLEGESFRVGKYHEDEFFTYRILAKAEKLAYVDAALYFYFQRQGSIMNSVSARHLDSLDAYLERIAFEQDKYPRLALQDKRMICSACTNLYMLADRLEKAQQDVYRGRIKQCRTAVKFSAGELLTTPVKQLVYILGSGWNIELFCALLKAVRRERT